MGGGIFSGMFLNSSKVCLSKMNREVTAFLCFFFYPQALYEQEPSYSRVIQAGKDARYLWFALQGWLAEPTEEYFGSLGVWAERKILAREEGYSPYRPCSVCGC